MTDEALLVPFSRCSAMALCACYSEVRHDKEKPVILWNPLWTKKCVSNAGGMTLIKAMRLILKSETFRFLRTEAVRTSRLLSPVVYTVLWHCYSVPQLTSYVFFFFFSIQEINCAELVRTCCGVPSEASQKIITIKKKKSSVTGDMAALA